MSTAGKVLSVLVALMVLVSIYLLSMVSQLNRNWGQGIETVSKQIEQVDEQVRQTQVDAFALQQNVVAERQITNSRLRSFQIRIEDLENRVTFLKEDQLRLQLRLDDEQALIARNQESVAGREAEMASLRADLDQENTRRDQLSAANSEKFDRLSSLRDQFSMLVAENQELLEQVASRASDGAASDSDAETSE